MNEAPDFVEPLEAWRIWKVIRRDGIYSLGSVVQRTVWPAGEALVAECLAGGRLSRLLRRRKPRHDAPEVDCRCGIYAGGLDVAGRYAADTPVGAVSRVLGQVALWGRSSSVSADTAPRTPTRRGSTCPPTPASSGGSAGARWRSVSAATACRSSRWRPGPPTRPVSSLRDRESREGGHPARG